ncbi:hypothetical protein COOONC_01218, partial [Cooperia oncophora]
LDFRASIDCWVCTSIFLNPGCWPHGAIFVLVLTLYGIIGLIYTLLYVPVIIGKPLRLLLAGAVPLVRCLVIAVTQLFLKLLQKSRIGYRSSLNARLTAALARAASLCWVVEPAFSCQQVNLLKHHAAVCTNKDGKELCSVRLTENYSKIRWIGLYLRCEEETEYYTRSTTVDVVDSKRCPYMGSGEKCASISSTIPVASSSVFLPSLITRPSTEYFVICAGRKRSYAAQLVPNVPVSLETSQIAMTSLTMPPTPQLNSAFITDGYDTAIWTNTITPKPKINCQCAAAKSKVRCECPSYDVAGEFNHIPRKLPVRTPFWGK